MEFVVVRLVYEVEHHGFSDGATHLMGTPEQQFPEEFGTGSFLEQLVQVLHVEVLVGPRQFLVVHEVRHEVDHCLNVVSAAIVV